MISPLKNLVFAKINEQMFSVRMYLTIPVLALCIVGSVWGLTDANTVLPADIPLETPMDILFVSSLFVLLSATLAGVIISYDGVSKDRASGVLEVKLSQPCPRRVQAIAMLLGYWLSIGIPVAILNIISYVILATRMDEFPSMMDLLSHFIATELVVLWYVQFSLLASSFAKDQSSSISIGIGMWFTFTMLWLLVTSVIAGLSGIEVGASEAWIRFEAIMDLFSPNGVYHHLLEARMPQIDRGISPILPFLASIIWTLLPAFIFFNRFERLNP